MAERWLIQYYRSVYVPPYGEFVHELMRDESAPLLPPWDEFRKLLKDSRLQQYLAA